MDGRRIRLMACVEWMMAALAVVAIAALTSGPVQRMIGPRLGAALAHTVDHPVGIPPRAILVPVMLLLDGREIRRGDLHSRLEELLANDGAAGPLHVSRARSGDRHTRPYNVSGTRFYVVCERSEPNGQFKVAGIYLP
jgi:hypothetical protein